VRSQLSLSCLVENVD